MKAATLQDLKFLFWSTQQNTAKYQKSSDFFSSSKSTQHENSTTMTKSNRFGLLFLSDHHHNNKILEPLHIFISIILRIIICKSEYSMRITFEEIPNNFAYSVFSRHFKAMLDNLNKAYKLKLCLNIEKSCNF